MSQWQTTIRVGTRDAKVLVTDEMGDEILRARLPCRPDHPRSLLTMLEGIALWSGRPVIAAISVTDSVRVCDRDLWGGFHFPAESALVRFQTVTLGQARRLRGLGSFRDVLRLRREGLL
jgi:hypothetical protein